MQLNLITSCRRWLLATYIILLGSAGSLAQSAAIDITIKWKPAIAFNPVDYHNEGKPRNLLSFDKAIYSEASALLPLFSERYLISAFDAGKTPQISLINPIFEILPADQKVLISQDLLGDIDIQSWVQQEQDQLFVRVEFCPIRKNKSTGQIERLLSSRLEIKWLDEIQPGGLKSSTNGFKPSSVLAQGNWYKIAVSETGIHKIPFDELSNLGFENPGQVRVYGNGGKQLPYDSSLPRPDDLVQNPVHYFKGDDGVFNSGDFLLFYARGPVYWTYDSQYEMFVHRKHLYSDIVYYYLSDQSGSLLQVSSQTAIGSNPTAETSTYDFYTHQEKDSLNLLHSGRQWCWKHFSSYLTWGFNISMKNKIPNEPVELLSSLWVRSSKTSPASKFTINVDGQAVGSVEFPGVNTSNYEALFASTTVRKTDIQLNKESFLLDYYFDRSNPAAQAWLDYFDINTRSQLHYSNAPLPFRDIRTVAADAITEFRIANANSGLFLWEVSEIDQITAVPYQMSNNTLTFKTKTDVLKEFVLFNPANELIPIPVLEGDGLGSVPNQNLHGLPVPEMVILVQDDLRENAEELANFHQTKDGIQSLILSPELIYNEFSSGIPDPTAIRDFLRMLYTRRSETEKPLKYLLLFGDGSYDNKKIFTDPDLASCLPTFQSYESLYPTRSFVTDDFFGLLDPGEMLEPGLLDIGIGRLPVRTPYEASIVVDKIINYNTANTLGDWRNLICFIGDDEDGNAHMRDANTLAELIDSNYPSFNLDKIFLDAYQQVVTATGETYPEVNRAISDRIKKGALIMNYLGHGSEKGLAHENILSVSDIKSWDNDGKLPLFMTATCEFSRFDDQSTSAGEWVLLNPNGGGIGLFTTTRLVYSSPNFRLNREFYDYVFKRVGGKKYRFGDLIRLTKNAVGSELNKLNFALLGDPALSLNFPEHRIVMTHVNGTPVASFVDTLKALSEVEVEGYIANLNGSPMDDYQGVVNPTVYDKEITLTNLANDGGPIMEFNVQENILFRGKSSIKDGKFKFNFLVPKDIGYNIGTGKFSFYASDGQSDGNGVDLNILIGGSSDSIFTDEKGPEVRLFMNDTSFAYGGITNEDPIFLAKVSDIQGINTTGNGIGHDITAIIDDNKQDIIVLNDYYESDLDNYKSGTIRYPINDLEAGSHSIKLKVWDNLNNSSESEIRFEVFNAAQVIIEHVLNYPNPFTTHTDFYFEHNQAGQALDVLIQIYTVSGRLVKSMNFLSATDNPVEAGRFRVGPISWDGLDNYGDRIGRGTYVYRVKIRTMDGRTQEAFQKLVKL